MANALITSAAGDLGASGLKSLLTFFGDRFLAVKRNRGGLLNVINTDYSADLAQMGQTVNVPIAGTTSTNLLTDGNAVTLDNTTGSSVALTLNKHRVAAFGFTQVAQALSGNNAMQGIIDQRIADMLNDIEYDVASVATAGFTTNTLGTYNTAFTEANAVSAISKLDGQKAPMPRYGFLHPNTNGWGAAIKISNFVNSQYIGAESPLSKDPGAYGTHYWNGVFWRMSQAVNIASGTDADGFIIARDAIVFASRPFAQPLSQGVTAVNMVVDGVALQMLVSWNKDKLADDITIHCLYGYAAGEEKYGCQYKL